MRGLGSALTLFALAALAACGSDTVDYTAPQPDRHESAYLYGTREEEPTYTADMTDADLLKLGDKACDTSFHVEDGAAFLDEMKKGTAWDRANQTVGLNALHWLCPTEYARQGWHQGNEEK